MTDSFQSSCTTETFEKKSNQLIGDIPNVGFKLYRLYLYVFEMMKRKINSNNKILILEYDTHLVNTCVRYIKSHGIKDIYSKRSVYLSI